MNGGKVTDEVMEGQERMFAVPELDDVGELLSMEAAARQVVADALETVRTTLAEMRALRDDTEAKIRQMVEEEETLKQAMGVFTRRERARGGE